MADAPASPALATNPPSPPLPSPPPPQGPGRLTIIGAGHVFQIESTIRDAIVALRPDVVFVELDQGRLNGLVQKRRGQHVEKGGGFVQRRIAGYQESIAGMFGADVGGEMLGAVAGARLVGARVALIDDPAEDTLRRALKGLTLRERLRALGMVAGGLVQSAMPWRRRQGKQDIEAEIRRYQENPSAMLGPGGELQRKFPTIHRVLVAERDAKMAARIRAQMATARHGVAVLGDAHVEGMVPILADLTPTVYRLAAVREGRLPRGAPVATGTTTSVGFTVDARI